MSRWTVEDKSWLLEAVEYLKLDGFPKIAELLREEVDKIKEERIRESSLSK